MSITDDPVRNSFDNVHGPGGRLSMRLRDRMDWPSLRRGYRRMRRQSVSQQRHVPQSIERLPVPMSKRISGYVVKNLIQF